MAVRQATEFLDKLSAAEAARPLEDRLMRALDQYLDIPLRRIAPMLSVSPDQAQRAVENLMRDQRAVVVETEDGQASIRRRLR
jgi:hypothetical protein